MGVQVAYKGVTIFDGEASWGLLGPSWAILGPSWSLLGPSWGHLGAILGPSWALLGPPWGHDSEMRYLIVVVVVVVAVVVVVVVVGVLNFTSSSCIDWNVVTSGRNKTNPPLMPPFIFL